MTDIERAEQCSVCWYDRSQSNDLITLMGKTPTSNTQNIATKNSLLPQQCQHWLTAPEWMPSMSIIRMVLWGIFYWDPRGQSHVICTFYASKAKFTSCVQESFPWRGPAHVNVSVNWTWFECLSRGWPLIVKKRLTLSFLRWLTVFLLLIPASKTYDYDALAFNLTNQEFWPKNIQNGKLYGWKIKRGAWL